jgi:hypothetical protein
VSPSGLLTLGLARPARQLLLGLLSLLGLLGLLSLLGLLAGGPLGLLGLFECCLLGLRRARSSGPTSASTRRAGSFRRSSCLRRPTILSTA